MKLEKINERQIRCILTKEDLENRKLRISELVCGGEKARSLLRDMMVRAANELGFAYNGNPLMIEAIPSPKGQLVLVITRVDDPNELDSKMAHFNTQDKDGRDSLSAALSQSLTGADDILNHLKKSARGRQDNKNAKDRNMENAAGGNMENGAENGQENRMGNGAKGSGAGHERALPSDYDFDVVRERPSGTEGRGTERGESKESYQYTRFYLFRSLEHVLGAASRVGGDYKGCSSLYKNPDDGAYYLLLSKMDTKAEQFNRICNVLSEYSMPMDYAAGMDEFFREHMQIIVADDALRSLRSI